MNAVVTEVRPLGRLPRSKFEAQVVIDYLDLLWHELSLPEDDGGDPVAREFVDDLLCVLLQGQAEGRFK